MSWITVVWAMVAAVCLTLAGLNVLVWCRRRAAWGNAIFALSAVATAAVAACELWMMRAETPHEWGVALRWLHLPGSVGLISLVVFVRIYLQAGRPWLAWTVCGMRGLMMIINFIVTPNLNYREITGLQHL